MKLRYKGARNRSNIEFIRLGVLKVGEAFIPGKVYDVPNELANAVKSDVWEKVVPTKKNKDGD